VAEARPPRAEPVCILAWGPDLNALLGTDLEIVTGEGGCDAEIAGHRHFAQLLLFWFNAPGGTPEVPLLYPPGYTPHDPDPFLDFMARLDATTYVVRPSGRTFTFTAHELQRHIYMSTLGEVFGGSGLFPPVLDDLRAAVLLPPLSPLRPGSYSVDISITFDEEVCPGVSDDPSSCFPAGTTFMYTRDITVSDR
jgi:hypothetical protein